MTSYWEATGTAGLPKDWPTWARTCDVLIIGAGFTGLAAAYYLAKSGLHVVIMEKHTVAYGASGRNGGQVLGGWPSDLNALRKRLGWECAQSLWTISEEALARVPTLIAEEGIHCDLHTVGHLEAVGDGGGERGLHEELSLLQSVAGHPYAWWDRTRIVEEVGTSLYVGGLYDPSGMAFHPRDYAIGLAHAGLRYQVQLHQSTPVQAVERLGSGRFRVRTPRGTVDSKEVILATNAYAPRFAHYVKARLLAVHSAQIAVQLDNPTLLPLRMPTVSDGQASYNYYRRVGEQVLLFGGRVPVRELRMGRYPSLLEQLRRVFPFLANPQVVSQWSGRIALSTDYMPHLHQLPNGIWTAGGYTGHGAALATQMGWLLSQGVLHGRECDQVRLLDSLPWQRWPLKRPDLGNGMLDI